jgi:hypothetical protein
VERFNATLEDMLAAYTDTAQTEEKDPFPARRH